jgi:hypothetical protein
MRFGYFDVVGSASGKRYRIGRGALFKIRELDENDDPASAWCVLPAVRLAPADEMLAKKIVLETSEREVLRNARRDPPRLRDIIPSPSDGCNLGLSRASRAPTDIGCRRKVWFSGLTSSDLIFQNAPWRGTRLNRGTNPNLCSQINGRRGHCSVGTAAFVMAVTALKGRRTVIFRWPARHGRGAGRRASRNAGTQSRHRSTSPDVH